MRSLEQDFEELLAGHLPDDPSHLHLAQASPGLPRSLEFRLLEKFIYVNRFIGVPAG